MSGPTMTVLTRFTAIHVITRTMRRNSLLGTQSPLAYAAQDGQLHPEVVRLLTAVVVAKSAAAAAVNKFPLTWRMTTPSSLVLLPPTCAHPILCYAGRTHFLKSRSDHAPIPNPITTPHTLRRGQNASSSAPPANVVLPDPTWFQLPPALSPVSLLPPRNHAVQSHYPSWDLRASRPCTFTDLCPETGSSERKQCLFLCLGLKNSSFSLEPS